MSKIHVGVVLLIIKEMCKSNETCDICPMDGFCTYNLCKDPEHWITDKIPDLCVNIRVAQKGDKHE